MTSAVEGAVRAVHGPEPAGGYWAWRGAAGGAEVAFVGRRLDGDGPPGDRARVLAAVAGERPVAWAKQVHSARVLRAEPGPSGEGDALVGGGSVGDGAVGGGDGLALSIATADCVPVLIAAGPRLAAVHAGWRGIAAGVVAAAVARLTAEAEAAGDPAIPADWSAWIGPAIGPCCYQVGPEVAAEVRAASADEAVVPQPAGRRPHLDLPIAVLAQLARAGVGTVRPLLWCTRCEPRLHSYRRDGTRTGSNLAFIWRP